MGRQNEENTEALLNFFEPPVLEERDDKYCDDNKGL